MATISVVLWTYVKNKEGKHPIKLRLSKQSIHKYFGLGLFSNKEQWNEEACLFKRDKRLNPNYIKENAKIMTAVQKAQKILDTFEDKNIDFTFNQFEEAYNGNTKTGNVKTYFMDLIKSLKETGHIGTAIWYKNTLNLLELYDKKFSERVFSEIDIKYVKKFDTFLQTPRESIYRYKSGKTRIVKRKGCAGNTRLHYIKGLRAVYNKAIQDKETTSENYPFGENGFIVAKLEEETEKRYIPNDNFQEVKRFVSQKASTEHGRKLFLFSYYCHGMSFIDIALLKKDNIKKLNDGDYIMYKRYKTRNSKKAKYLYVKITEEINTLIRDLCFYQQPVEDYLLPIITRSKDTEEEKYYHIKNRLKKFNKYLLQLEKEMQGLNVHVTTYVSRHTMAMSLQENLIPRELISQIMGHNKLETTLTYLDSFASKEINEATSVL